MTDITESEIPQIEKLCEKLEHGLHASDSYPVIVVGYTHWRSDADDYDQQYDDLVTILRLVRESIRPEHWKTYLQNQKDAQEYRKNLSSRSIEKPLRPNQVSEQLIKLQSQHKKLVDAIQKRIAEFQKITYQRHGFDDLCSCDVCKKILLLQNLLKESEKGMMGCKLGCCDKLQKIEKEIAQKLCELESNLGSVGTNSEFYDFLQKLVILQ